MKRKIALVLVSLTLLLSMCGGMLACDSGPEVSWKLATYTAAGTSRTEILENFADLVDEKTDGKMEIKVYPGGTLATADAIFDQVSEGAIEMGSVPISYYIGKMLLTGLAISPCWYWDVDNGLAARKKIISEWEPAINQLKDNNIQFLLWVTTGFVEMCFADDSVDSPDDVDGKIMATAASSVLEAMAKALGAGAEKVDMKEVVTAAQAGTIDASFAPVEDYVGFGMAEELPNLIMTQFFPTVYSSFMNNDAFNKLDADMKAAVLEAADEAEAEGLKVSEKELNDAVADLQADDDVNVTIPTGADRDAWWDVMGLAMYGTIWGGMSYGGDDVPGSYVGSFEECLALAEAAVPTATSPFSEYNPSMIPK
jgi:TRAP-type C4-dicarboxylate transport system substrate-binding protein